MEKTYLTPGPSPQSQIGSTLEALAATIAEREDADESSYTFRLLHGSLDGLLKKVVEEACEATLAAKDCERPDATEADRDHFRYEAGDVMYHLLVLLHRMGIDVDEFAAELNARMSDEALESRTGIILLKQESINRGK